MIEEYKLNYEVALARKAKLHCHPAEAFNFAWRNGEDNLVRLNNVLAHIEREFSVAEDTWKKERCSTKDERSAKASVVMWMNRQGLKLSAIARIMGMSIPSVRWNLKYKKTIFFPSIDMRIFDNE